MLNGRRAVSLASVLFAAVWFFALSSCGASDEEKTVATGKEGSGTMKLESAAFKNGEVIPKKHTGDGPDVSPPLAWSGAPEKTKQFALICDDPDAPTPEPWVHWVIYHIPATVTALKENIPRSDKVEDPIGPLQGVQSFGGVGYRGPAPPAGKVHHYHFKLYALDAELSLKPGLDKKKLLAAMKGHILAETDLVGTYKR
jgi:hypothetical protein